MEDAFCLYENTKTADCGDIGKTVSSKVFRRSLSRIYNKSRKFAGSTKFQALSLLEGKRGGKH